MFMIIRKWLQKRISPNADNQSRLSRYFLLFRQHQTVCAIDASHLLVSGDFPPQILFQGKLYKLRNHNVIFWDDLVDAAHRTVGYLFHSFGEPQFSQAQIWTDSENVQINSHHDVECLLRPCDNFTVECVQGFGGALYQDAADPGECVWLMLDWSENPIAFPLLDLPCEVTTS